MKSSPKLFEKLATYITNFAGSTPAFLMAFAVVIIWVFSGPFFDFSETWQLVINTGTTIITFLMVFLIQKSQNKESLAMQIKLDELIAASDLASNRIVSAENMNEEDLRVIRKYYSKLSTLSQRDEKLTTSHSIDEAEKIHDEKKNNWKKRSLSKIHSTNRRRKKPNKSRSLTHKETKS